MTILSYNVQNLFDATDTRNEYAEFRSDSGWNEDRYYERLRRLAWVLEEVVSPRPDVLVLQEVENAGVFQSLVRDFLRRRYHVLCAPEFAGPGPPESVRVVVASRLPVQAARIHRSVGVAVSPGGTLPVTEWAGRAMVEAEIDGRSGVFRLFAAHWKSQSGGERETEPQRLQAAALVGTVVRANPSGTVLLVGDLNEDVEEFAQHGGAYLTALMPFESYGSGEGPVAAPAAGLQDGRSLLVTGDAPRAGWHGTLPVFYSPWLSSGSPGTYHHRGRWERLDQALLLPDAGGARATVSLQVVSAPELVTEAGAPRRYDARTGAGYSDHLPVLFTLSWE